MTEPLVPHNIAVMLKEAGFDFRVSHYYEEVGEAKPFNNRNQHPPQYDFNSRVGYEDCCSAPTLSLAAQWLREVHGLHVCADYNMIMKHWDYRLRDVIECSHNVLIAPFPTHDHAYTAAIEKALIILKERKAWAR